jgi:hypothetical protein
MDGRVRPGHDEKMDAWIKPGHDGTAKRATGVR